MDKNLQNIEDLFRKGLEGNEEAPSEEVWNGIDQSLEKANSLKFRKKYYSLKRATAVLVVMVALLTFYVLRNESHKQTQDKSKNKNVVTSEPTLKNRPNIEKETTAEKIEKVSPENKAESQSEETQNSNLESKKANAEGNSLLQNKANETSKAEKEIVSNLNSNSKANQLGEESKNGSEISVNQKNISATKQSATITTENKSEKLQQQTALIVPPVLHFSPQEVLQSMSFENLKNVGTISPYSSPTRIANKTAIHIPSPRRFYASVFYSPKVAFSHLRDEDHGAGNPYSRELEKNEKGSYSYSFGVLMDYQLNKKWALETGLNFSTIRMNLEPEKIYAERDNQGTVKYQITTSSGKGYILPSFSTNPRIGDSLFTRKINHSLQYTSIPVAAKYFLSQRRLSVNLLAGISTNIFSKGNISTEVNSGNESEHEKTHEIHGLKPVYFSGIAGFGLNYNIYRNLSLTFAPTFNFAIDPINRDVRVNSYPGTIDFQVGLKSSF